MDQPAVVADAPDGRIERVGGDFFKDVPIQADAYVMRWIRLVGRGVRRPPDERESGRQVATLEVVYMPAAEA